MTAPEMPCRKCTLQGTIPDKAKKGQETFTVDEILIWLREERNNKRQEQKLWIKRAQTETFKQYLLRSLKNELSPKDHFRYAQNIEFAIDELLGEFK